MIYHDTYNDEEQKITEAEGRRRFLLFIRPIINGTGNYYIESQTRDNKRTDLIIDYLGHQYIVEMKIWRGNSYHSRGESQLHDYLDYYHLDKGYMLSFCFNKSKKIGVQTLHLKGKELVEAIV